MADEINRVAYEGPSPERPASASPTEQTLERETPGGSKARGHDPYAALRYRDCRRYLTGFVVSVVGQQMLSVAVAWEIYERTGKAGALGLVGLVQAIPIIFLALPAGHLADLFNRRAIVMVGQAVLAVCSAGLAVTSWRHGPVVLMFGILLAMAINRAFTEPARSALLPQLLPLKAFSNAVSWNSSAWQMASTIGPMAGGSLIAWFENRPGLRPWAYAAVYAVNAATALCFLVFVWMVPKHKHARGGAMTLESLGAGLRFVWQTKIILATITLDLFAVLLGGAVALLPIYAKDILHTNATGLGWLRAAPAIGAVAMAMVVAHRPPMKRAGRALLWAVAGFGAATIVFGLSHWFWLSLLMLALTGAFDNISVLVRHTLVQVLTPDAMRGRVSAVNNVFIGASNELGEFESGMTAELFQGALGVPKDRAATLSAVAGGVGSIVVVAVVAAIWPSVRRFGSLSGHVEGRDRAPERQV